ncbi:hypothetical protein KAR91_83625 [Candidatus Pacearchaeota archaeon]|nr:hypothetical protein [Candidatus Pacearchaeota archaeon]
MFKKAKVDEELDKKIGYTTDGLVFFITDAMDPNGQSLQATFTWDPDTALEMAQEIANAAGEAAKFYKKGTQ